MKDVQEPATHTFPQREESPSPCTTIKESRAYTTHHWQQSLPEFCYLDTCTPRTFFTPLPFLKKYGLASSDVKIIISDKRLKDTNSVTIIT